MAEKKQPRTKIVRDYFKAHPNVSVLVASAALSIPAKYIYQIRYMDKKKARDARASKRLEKEFLKRVTSPDTPPVIKPIMAEFTQHKDGTITEKVWAPTHVIATNGTFDTPFDPVNHPAHYKKGGIETIDFIEAKQLPYNLGNVVKYVTRAEHKGAAVEDLRKAQWYLSREIRRVTNARA